MLTRYREVLRLPGSWQFSSAGVVARLPIGMTGLAMVMLISLEYGSYAWAGATSAAYVLAVAVCAPQLSRAVDRYGQSLVMRPAVTISGLANLALAYAAAQHAPAALLVGLALVAGATQGSMTSLVRARWTHVAGSSGQLHTAYSMEAALDEVSFMLGPVLSTWLAAAVAPWLPLVVAALAQLAGGWLFLSLRATEPPPSGGRPGAPGPGGQRGSGTRLRGIRVLWLVFAAYLMMGVVFGAVDVSTVAFAGEVGRPSLAGPALLVFSLGSFLAGLVYGARQWRGAPWQHFIGGTVLIACGTGTFFFADSIVLLAGLMFVTGLTLSPTFVAGQTLVQRLVPGDRVTEGLSWIATSINAGVALGSSVAGVGVDRLGSPGGFVVTLAGAGLALLVALTAAPVLRRRAS
ncbi:MFS transporter [Raineyella antarctica]|uniref:MFS transporter n=1 Tax=Raineyella antarctica TaxID=1577474 RepID=UPI0015882787|nr:MFS transporter [Raineyella antarctica]